MKKVIILLLLIPYPGVKAQSRVQDGEYTSEVIYSHQDSICVSDSIEKYYLLARYYASKPGNAKLFEACLSKWANWKDIQQKRKDSVRGEADKKKLLKKYKIKLP